MIFGGALFTGVSHIQAPGGANVLPHLVSSPDDMRKPGATEGIENIRAIGLLQNIQGVKLATASTKC
jgi:hypothetical protein